VPISRPASASRGTSAGPGAPLAPSGGSAGAELVAQCDGAAGALVARELYGIECPIVELDATWCDAVAACAGARLDVDASGRTAVVRVLDVAV
jgi:hypothetical protein